MIVQNSNTIISTNVPQNGTGFTINATAQAFQILSSGIYQHKIAAIVRELMTNAYDSHVQAGKAAVPFSVILPTTAHPYFEVEDFGVGLDMDDAVNIYTVYFKSTKQDSNEVAGTLGLGSKVGFSYTKQFNIRIRKNGVERVAVVYIGEDGSPRLDFVHTVNTDMPNGVKVTIPVAQKDFSDFESEFEFYSSFYAVPPVCNKAHIKPAFDPEAFRGDGDFVVVEREYNNSAALGMYPIYALMGPVVYPIDINSVTGVSNEDSNVLETINKHNRSSILFIRFNIGDVNVAASRESLSLDTRTCAVVAEKISQYVKQSTRAIREALHQKGVHITDRINNAFQSTRISQLVLDEMRGMEEVWRFKKTPTIKKLCNVELYRGWSVKNRSYKIKKMTYEKSYFNIVFSGCRKRDVINILCVDTDKKWVYDLVDSHVSEKGTLVWCGKMSESQRVRLEKIFGVKVEITSYLALYENMLAEKRKNRQSKPRTKYENHHIHASGFDFFKGGIVCDFYQKQVEVDANTFYYDTTELDYADPEYIMSDIKTAMRLLSELGHEFPEHVKVVRKNSRNAKKIERLGVGDVVDVIQNAAVAHKDYLSNLNCIYHEELPEGLVLLAVNAGSIVVPDSVTKAYNELMGYLEKSVMFDSYRISHIIRFMNEEAYEQRKLTKSKITQLCNSVKNVDGNYLAGVYPLLDDLHLGKYAQVEDFKTPSKWFRHVMMYINMVDKMSCSTN